MRARWLLWGCMAAAMSCVPRVVPAADGAWSTYLRPSLYSDLIAEADTVWIGAADGGLLRYTPSADAFESFVREPSGLASNRVGPLSFDARRRLWVGTMGGGVSVLDTDRTTWSLVNAFDGLPSDSVTVLEAKGDTMLVGTTQGFAVWNGREVEGRLPDGINPSPFASDYITGMAVLGDSLWLSTRAGAYVGRLSDRLRSWTRVVGGLVNTQIDGMVSDGSTLLALAGFAAYRLNPATAQWSIFTGLGAVRAISGDRGAVFAAGGGGLFRWNGTGWTNLNPSLNSSSVGRFVATRDENDVVYAAGRPAASPDPSATGVYHPTSGGGPWHFALPPGPAGNNCMNIEVEGPRTYVTTFDQGVSRFDGASWKNWFVANTPVRGAAADTTLRRPAYAYAALSDKSGRKWFGFWSPASYVGLSCVADTGAIEVLDDSGVQPVVERRLGGGIPRSQLTFARASTLDSTGSIWFGMDSPCVEDPNLVPIGLERYNPTGPPSTAYAGNYTRASTGGMLPSDQIWSMVTDRLGRVWVGTNRGLALFQTPAIGAPPSLDPVTGTEQLVIRGLAAYRDSLWVLTSSEVRRYDASTTTLKASYGIPAQPSFDAVRPLDVSADGTIWIATVNGVRSFSKDGTRRDYTTENSPLASDDVRTIRVDRRTGHVWLATSAGVNRFDPGYTAPATVLPALTVRAYPNPVRLTGIGLAIRLDGNSAGYSGAIYDLNGRRVRSFDAPGNGRVVWDGRDRNGDLVHPGIYFLRAHSAGRSAVVRIAVVR